MGKNMCVGGLPSFEAYGYQKPKYRECHRWAALVSQYVLGVKEGVNCNMKLVHNFSIWLTSVAISVPLTE